MPKSSWPARSSRAGAFLTALVFAFLAMRLPADSQGETTSAIIGSVVDPAGAAIAGAKVTVTSTDNGLRRSVKTDDAGRFNFPQLKPGRYSVKAEASQFEAKRIKPLWPAWVKNKPSISR